MSDDVLDIGKLQPSPESQLTIKHPQTGALTTWIWTFYGPAHEKSIELGNRLTREMMRESREKEEARVNGKKWRADDISVDEFKKRYAVEPIAGRVKFFTPVRMNGEDFQFSPEATRKLLCDPAYEWLLKQIREFIAEEQNFMKPSVNA